MGGHVHTEGMASPTSVAGEVTGVDLCKDQGPDGRVIPTGSVHSSAKCLICRTGVQGWLRVYT
jgi:hypothetical protein